MRHIPEDELHAYLDQALSRSQCVEIESHLAACPSCQATRDGIAALRDRTTALLARLAPPRSISPSFESLAPARRRGRLGPAPPDSRAGVGREPGGRRRARLRRERYAPSPAPAAAVAERTPPPARRRVPSRSGADPGRP